MSKKKRKNSDYHYMQRQYDEAREKREREAIKAQKRKFRLIFILAVVLIVGSLILCLVAYSQSLTWMSPLYLGCSGLGMLLLYWYYKEDKPKYATAALVMGVVILIIALMQARSLGWLKYLGFNL